MSFFIRTRKRAFAGLGIVACLCACAGFEEMAAEQLAAKPDARILAIGDSVMWWNTDDGGSIADVVAGELGEPVVNLAVPGAAVSNPNPAMAVEGLDIGAQYVDRGWAWVIVEGGANDLGDESGPHGCTAVLEELVSADGKSGDIPSLVGKIRADGARVVAMGYYDLPPSGEREGFCGDILGMLSERIEVMASLDGEVFFVGMADVVDPEDASAFDRDAVHPSVSASRAIGRLVATAIEEAERR